VLDLRAYDDSLESRVLGQWPFDEQVVAALALSDGSVVEMQTGEGKTLAGVMLHSTRCLGTVRRPPSRGT
jgi:preprotein translocase subunit SecA